MTRRNDGQGSDSYPMHMGAEFITHVHIHRQMDQHVLRGQSTLTEVASAGRDVEDYQLEGCRIRVAPDSLDSSSFIAYVLSQVVPYREQITRGSGWRSGFFPDAYQIRRVEIPSMAHSFTERSSSLQVYLGILRLIDSVRQRVQALVEFDIHVPRPLHELLGIYLRDPADPSHRNETGFRDFMGYRPSAMDAALKAMNPEPITPGPEMQQYQAQLEQALREFK